MRITYDEEVDAVYLRLKETPYYESDEIKEGLILDYDKGRLSHRNDKNLELWTSNGG